MSVEASGPPIECTLAEDKELKLLTATRWDKRNAFERLWAAHRASLKRFICFHIGPDDQSADHIAAEVHDIVERGLDLDRAKNSRKGFHKYIRSTAYFKCRHHRRYLNRHEPISGTSREEEEDATCRHQRVGIVLEAPESSDPLIFAMWVESYRLFFGTLVGSPFPPQEILFFAYVWLLYRVDDYCKPSTFWDECSGERLAALAEDFWRQYTEAADIERHAPHTAEEMRASMDSFRAKLRSATPDGGTVGDARLVDHYASKEEALGAWQGIRERIRAWVLRRLPW